MKIIDRESLGQKVHAIRILATDIVPDSGLWHVVPWTETTEPVRELSRRIGEQLFGLGVMTAMRPAKARRVCAECGASIGKHHKWFIGADSKIRHRNCSQPQDYA